MSIVAILFGIIALINWKDRFLKIFHILLLASFLVASGGIYFHLKEEDDEISLTIEEQLYKENEKDKPILAPLTFGGLALVGLLGTSRKWKAEVKN